MRPSSAGFCVLLLLGCPSAEASTNPVIVNLDTFPAVITAPGMYRLAGPVRITNASSHGLTVRSDGVTIDLGGFNLTGPGRGSGSGIFQPADFKGLTVSNGIVAGWQDAAGTEATDAGYGILVRGSHARLVAVTVTDCDRGLRLGSFSSVLDTTAYSNSLLGFYLEQGGLVRGCTAYNSGTGFEAGVDSTIDHSTAYGNSGVGFQAAKDVDFATCTANNNATGFACGSGCDVINAAANGNTEDGIVMEHACVARECSANENGRHGIRIGDACESDRNTAHANVDCGIVVTGTKSRVTQCKTIGNRFGIALDGPGNVILGNMSGENRDANYRIVEGNTVGRVVADEDPDSQAADDMNIDLDQAPTPAK